MPRRALEVFERLCLGQRGARVVRADDVHQGAEHGQQRRGPVLRQGQRHVAWDRLREPRRDPTRPFAVVDPRTYRDAQRRIERLLDVDDTLRARCLMHAICLWLRHEVRIGRRSRRVKRAAELEQWELRLAQLLPAT